MNKLSREILTSDSFSSKFSGESILAEQCISERDFKIHEQEILAIKLVHCRLKGTLHFMSCTIEKDLSIERCILQENVTINDCQINGDLTIFNSSTKSCINISSSEISGKIRIESSSCRELIIFNSSFNGLEFYGSEAPASIKKIVMNKARSDGCLIIRFASDLDSMDISNSEIMELSLEKLNINQTFDFKIKSSKINYVNFKNITSNDRHDLNISMEDNTSNEIIFFNSNLEKSMVVVKNCTVKQLLKFKQCQYDECTINFSESDICFFDIDEIAFEFLNSSNNYSPIYNPTINMNSKLDMLKKIKENLADNHLHNMEDNAYYLLKNTEMKIRISRLPFYKKAYFYIFLFFCRYMFGWGVKFRPPALFSVISICAYSAICYIHYGLYNQQDYLVYLDSKLVGAKAAAILALATFLGQVGDIESTFALSIYHHMAFFAFGVVMVTLMTGIIIRKLVR